MAGSKPAALPLGYTPIVPSAKVGAARGIFSHCGSKLTCSDVRLIEERDSCESRWRLAALAEDDTLAPMLERADATSLLPQLWRALGAPFASPATRAAALSTAESLIERAEEAKFKTFGDDGDGDEEDDD